MNISMLKCKIHRATITEADLNYEGSITVDPDLCRRAGLYEFECVDVYNITNGQRFSTYVIFGTEGQICVNGAAARLVQKNDLVIICAYMSTDEKLAMEHKPTVVLVDEKNRHTKTVTHAIRK